MHLSSWNLKVQIYNCRRIPSANTSTMSCRFFVITFSVTYASAVLWMPVKAQPHETTLTYGKPHGQNKVVLHINMHIHINTNTCALATETPCLLTILEKPLNAARMISGVAFSISHKMLMSWRCAWKCLCECMCLRVQSVEIYSEPCC